MHTFLCAQAEEWPEGAPPKLVKKLEEAPTPKAKRRARSELAQLGRNLMLSAPSPVPDRLDVDAPAQRASQ